MSVADRAGAGQDLAETRVAVSGGVGKRVEDAVGGGVEGKDAGKPVSGEEGDDCRVGARVGDNVDRRKGGLSKCLRDVSRPVIRRPWSGTGWAAVGAPCSSMLSGAQRV